MRHPTPPALRHVTLALASCAVLTACGTSSAGLLGDTQRETIAAAPPAKLGFVSPSRVVRAGDCSPEVEVEAQDSFGNPASLSAQTAVSLTASPTLALFEDASCTRSIASVSLPVGVGIATFHFRGAVAGAWSISLAASGLLSGSQSETVVPADADHLAFTTAAQGQIVGTCSSVVALAVRDRFENAASGASARAVTLGVSSASVALFLDAACSQPASAVDIAAGTATAGFLKLGHLKPTAVARPQMHVQ